MENKKEDKKEEEVKPEEKKLTLLEQVREERIKLESAIKEKRELLDREDKMKADNVMAGRAEAGKPVTEDRKEKLRKEARKLTGELDPFAGKGEAALEE